MSDSRKTSRENVLIQLGDYCTKHSCKNCILANLAHDNNHGCPEFLRIPELAREASEMLKHRRTHRNDWEGTSDV